MQNHFSSTSFKVVCEDWRKARYEPVVFLIPQDGSGLPLLSHGTVPDTVRDLVIQRISSPTLPPLPVSIEYVAYK